MTKEQFTEFAKLVVKHVRDKAIGSSDAQLYAKNSRAPIANHWRKARESGDMDKYAETIIADCIDDAIGCFLLAIDEGVFKLSFKTTDGEYVAADELEGEICGWYMGDWREHYSTKRVFTGYGF